MFWRLLSAVSLKTRPNEFFKNPASFKKDAGRLKRMVRLDTLN